MYVNYTDFRLRNASRVVLKTLVLLAVGLMTLSCVYDDDMCGDNMELYMDTLFGGTKYCTPKILPDSDTTQLPPENTDSENLDSGVTDAGDDTGTGDDGAACTKTAECPDGQYCDTSLSPPACRPPATGEGTTCETQADCAGFEADYCEAYVSFTCLVQNCDASNINSCSPDYICCDFSWMGLPSLCVNAELSGGVCQ